MPSLSPSTPAADGPARRTVVVLGTGGTIAGSAGNPLDHTGYVAGQRDAQALLGDLPVNRVMAPGTVLEVEQLAQLDSKDMDVQTWVRLARRCAALLERADVCGIVITHGTDTLEETGVLLHQLLSADRPVVLTAAMRPASALDADGPRNLLDALQLASTPGVCGVLAVLGGQVFAAVGLRKRHPYRLEAFEDGDGGPLAVIEAGRLRVHRPWPRSPGWGVARLPESPAAWPWVEVLSSHAAARPEAIQALVAAGVAGLVLAATGNGTVHQALEPAVAAARAKGVRVWMVSRCALGRLVGVPDAESPAAGLSPWQARVLLMLDLMLTDSARPAAPPAS